MIYELAGVQHDDKTVVFICPQCLVVPNQALGAQNREQLVYAWICPVCNRTLAEWVELEERENELRAFAAKVQAQKPPSRNAAGV